MPIESVLPNPLLAPYINAYLYYDQQSQETSQTISVTGQQFLWAILDGKVSIKHPRNEGFDAPEVGMIGHFTHAARTEQVFPCRAAAVIFKPFACHGLFGFNMHTFHDFFIDISDAKIGNGRLFDALHSCTGAGEIKLIFDRWLLQAMEHNTFDISLIRSIVDTIEVRQGNIRMEEILDQFCITERTLQRLFNKTIGINPKLFLRIVRFNYVLSKLDDHSQTLSEIIDDAGYFDRPHFIKDFLQFTGCNPSFFSKDAGYEASRETLKAILKNI